MFAQICGRGGTGRRAGLRSLFPQGSGSSILLVRTTIFEEYRVGSRADRFPAFHLLGFYAALREIFLNYEKRVRHGN